MGNTFTQRLRQYFERNTTLRIVPQNGDLRLSGAVESYQIESVAPQGTTDQILNYGNLTRIRVTVSASYYNTQASEFNFENKKFTFFKDIDQEAIDIVSQEEQILADVMEQIILDIFMASLANW